MSKAQLVITAVVLEGPSKSEVARDYDVALLGTAAVSSLRSQEGLRRRCRHHRHHLAIDPGVAKVPVVSTIWRILTRRGFVVPNPTSDPLLLEAVLRRTTQ